MNAFNGLGESVVHLRDHLLSCQLQRAYTAIFPPDVKGMRLWSCEVPNWYRSLIVANGLGRNRTSSWRELPQPIRGFPTSEPVTFLCKP